MIQVILSILSFVILCYVILCCINVFMSWIPGAKFTSFGKFVSKVTNPYLNFFSKSGKLRIGNIDFSPALAIGILTLLASILGQIGSNGYIRAGVIISSIVGMLLSLIISLLGILFLIVFIRWIVLLVNKKTTPYNSIWNSADGFLNTLTSKITGPFTKKSMSYDKKLLAAWIILLILIAIGSIIRFLLCSILLRIPF
ncbi:MAG: YggT family protein [Treponema sp.]|nr:YggT family protein [Treponema sp.]